VRRTLANNSGTLADTSTADIAQLKATWWQGAIPSYLQWSDDVGAIETAYTLATTGNVLQRTTGVKNAGVTYANEVAAAILAFENGSVTAQSQYFESLLSLQETAAEKRFKATRDQEIALAEAELQKQLTGNETAYNTAVTKANAAYESAITSAESTRTAALKTASAQRTTALAQITKTKDSAIAQSERVYDQVVAALDAQYGSASANGDTGIEGARRDASISTRDAQYYASRDTSWASALNSSASLGTSPWIVKERTSANAQAAYSTNRANAQATHDAALLSAIDNWQTSNRSSTLSLLLAEGQSREAYNQATANVYANWEMGVGKLFADKPDGTRWSDESDESQANETPTPVSSLVGIFSFDWFGDEEDKEDTSDLPEDPSVAEIANDKIVQYRDAIKSLPSFSCSLNPIEQWVHTGIRNWGVDLFAGAVAVGLHDTIKKVDPTANADAAFLLAWAGESNIPSLMTVNDPIHSQTVEFVQSLARDKAIELNRGHAGLGVSGTPVMDEVAFEAPTSLLSAGLPKMLGMGARVSKKISEEGIELVLDTARRLDDEAIEAIWRAGKTLDNADGIPLEKVLDVGPVSSFNPVSAERIARYQSKVDAFYAAGVRGEKLAELQGRVQMLSEGFIKVGPGKWNRSGQGIDSIFRKFDNPTEFAILESKWSTRFRPTHNHLNLLNEGYGFRQMDIGWINQNIENLLDSQHFPMRQRFGELLLEHGYQHRYMNVMNGSGNGFLFTLP
jgi:hypothetical protein